MPPLPTVYLSQADVLHGHDIWGSQQYGNHEVAVGVVELLLGCWRYHGFAVVDNLGLTKLIGM